MPYPFVALSELCTKNVELIDPKRQPDHQFSYIDISAVDNQSKRITTPQRVFGKDASVRARQVIQKNDVLVATTRPNLNAVAIVPEALAGQVCSTGFCVLRTSPLLDPEYLFAYVQSPMFVQALTDLVQGALYPAVTDKQVRAQKIPLPRIEEQRRIAAALKAQLAEVEKARAELEAQCTDIEKLKSAVFQQVFEAIAQTNRKRIGDIANTTSGTTPSRSNKAYWEPAIHPWVKTGEVAFAPITQTEEAVSAQALKECSLSLLPVGTVLVAMYGQGKTRGQSAVLQVPATTNQACFAILPNEQFEPRYLQYWLQYSYPDMRALSDSRGGNQSNLNGSMLNDFEMPLIPLEQQRQVVKTLEQALAEVSRLEEGIQAQQAEVALLPARLLAQAFGEG